MKARRITGACLSLMFASAAASFAQQPAKPSVTERTYLPGGLAPARVVERRIVGSDGRETVVGTEERPDADGRWTPVEQIVHESNRSADGSVRTTRTVSGFDFDRRRTLLERTEGIENPSVNGIARSIEDTWIADINGGLGLASRRIEERNTVDSDVRQTSTTVLTRGINGGLQESHRTAQTERRLDPSVVRHETAHMERDPNGRWTAFAAHSADVRSGGSSESVEEETVHSPRHQRQAGSERAYRHTPIRVEWTGAGDRQVVLAGRRGLHAERRPHGAEPADSSIDHGHRRRRIHSRRNRSAKPRFT